jgi:hypothetical protein
MPRSQGSGAGWPTWSVGPDGFYGSGWGETIDWEVLNVHSGKLKQAADIRRGRRSEAGVRAKTAVDREADPERRP